MTNKEKEFLKFYKNEIRSLLNNKNKNFHLDFIIDDLEYELNSIKSRYDYYINEYSEDELFNEILILIDQLKKVEKEILKLKRIIKN